MRSCVIALCLFTLCGCSLAKAPKSSVESPSVPGLEHSLQPGEAVYFSEFTDLPLPRQMELMRDETIIAGAPSALSGFIALSGRVSASSLYAFFEQALPNYGWKPRGVFRSARGLLIYEQANRDLAISISEGALFTRAEIWVIERRQAQVSNLTSQALGGLKLGQVGITLGAKPCGVVSGEGGGKR